MHADLAPGLVLQLPYELDQLTVHGPRVGPVPIERRRGGDVLRDAVDECRERLDVATRPEPGPLLVAPPAQDDRVLRRDDGAEVVVHRLVPIMEELVGTLGDAVQGQLLVHDDLAHAKYLRLT